MRRIHPILRCGAAAVVWLASSIVFARQVVTGGDARTSARARQWQLRGLASELRPFYRYELMHVRAACGLSKEQFREIRPEADAAYERAIARVDAARAASPRSAGDDEPDYQEAIRQAVHSVARRHVSRERWDALQADLRRRRASRREAGVELLVAVIDRELLLSAEQRREIAGSIAGHWEDRFLDPLEVAFNDQSRCPKIPDELVAPFLSPDQREAWRRLPRLQGRLWGVTIDHGGDAAMERELGVDEKRIPASRRPPVRPDPPAPRANVQPVPADVVRRRIEVIQPAGVEVLRVIRPPVEARLAVPPVSPREDPDEPDQPVDPAVARRQRLIREQHEVLTQHYLSLFNRQVYGGSAGERETREQLESALERRVHELKRTGGFDDPQARKLRAAGRGDLKRFFDRAHEARQQLRAEIDRSQPAAVNLSRIVRPLTAEREALEKVEGPIFARTLARTLTDAHRAAIEQDACDRLAFRLRADVRWTTVLIARSLGLLDDQRRRLEAVLAARLVPPRKFESSDYMIVMYQASRVPEDEIRPIFDDLQWRVMSQELAAARRWELTLRRGGFLPEELFGDPSDAPLPPIHLLAPPAIPARR